MASAQACMRHLLSARSEWGLSTVIAKIDIAKAYDTLEHAAIHTSFERQGMPAPLQAAYWRCHAGRVLHFSSSDGGGGGSSQQNQQEVYPKAARNHQRSTQR